MKKKFTACAFLVLALMSYHTVWAQQQLTGTIAAGYTWQDVNGRKGAFRSQNNLEDGYSLKDLHLQWKQTFLDAWGFGQSEPTEHVRFFSPLTHGLNIDFSYDSRDSFLSLSDPDFINRADKWHINRWGGTLHWEGWSFARLSLGFYRADRQGDLLHPFYGLNSQYEGSVDLDEFRNEAVVTMETKTLPVHLIIEQAYAHYKSQNRWSPESPTPLIPNDPNRLQNIGNSYDYEQDIPTTRIMATWFGHRVAVASSFMWSSADFDSSGSGWQDFELDGGSVGTAHFTDNLIGSATTDTLNGDLNIAITLTENWHLKLKGSYRDASTDSDLLGQRLLHIANPDGLGLDVDTPLDDNGNIDFTDVRGEIDLEYRRPTWSAWIGSTAASRDVNWQRSNDGAEKDVNRDSTAILGGLAMSLGKRVDINLEYEHGDFNDYIFRVDPETIDRFKARLTAKLNYGLSLNAHGQFQFASNPADEASLDSDSSIIGAALAWVSPDTASTLGLDYSIFNLNTDTDLVLPGNTPGNSEYDLSLQSLSVFGSTQINIFELSGSCHYYTDNGDSWPVDALNLEMNLGVRATKQMKVEGFMQYWSYDEDHADLDDFDALRYGVALRWSF